MHELLKGLSSDNDVDVLTLSDGTPDSGAAVEQLRADGFAVDPIVHRPPTSAAVLRSLRTGRSFYRTRFASDAFSLALQARIARHRYDVVQCEFAYMAQYAPAEPAHNGPRWILDAHNVEFRLNQTLAGIGQGSRGAVYRAYARREQRLRHSEELDACRRVDRVVSVSDTDRDVLLRELPGLGVDVVPNGVDVERFSPSLRPETDRAPSAIFVGKIDSTERRRGGVVLLRDPPAHRTSARRLRVHNLRRAYGEVDPRALHQPRRPRPWRCSRYTPIPRRRRRRRRATASRQRHSAEDPRSDGDGEACRCNLDCVGRSRRRRWCTPHDRRHARSNR